MDGSRILVIDDSTTLRKLVEIAMRGTGWNVDFAATGSDGVSRARTIRPDVILLDYLLPDLRSAEVCQRLHDDTSTSSVPVVIMSANQRSVLEDFRPFSAVVGFIGKPFTATEIRSRLEGVVRRGGGRSARGTDLPLAGHTTLDGNSGPAASAAAHNPARAIATGSTADQEADAALQLRGDLATTPMLEVLRLLVAAHATGTLVVEQTATTRLWLRRGEILMCASSHAEPSALDPLAPELRERVVRNLLTGKPAQVTLAEAGASQAINLALELHAASAQLIGELLDARCGRFGWEAAASLPDFVDAFGRQVSLTAVALDHARRTPAGPVPGVLDPVYDRTPRFSDRLAGARLNTEEQRVLASIDGKTAGRDIVARAKLASDQGAAILTRLRAADLIRSDVTPHSAPARTVAVLAADGDDLADALRARLGSRPRPIDVIELDPGRSLAAATLEARPVVVLIGITALSRHVLEHELPVIARDTTTAVVGVLESPNPPLANQLLRAGLHAVLAKPVHVTEIERLLLG